MAAGGGGAEEALSDAVTVMCFHLLYSTQHQIPVKIKECFNQQLANHQQQTFQWTGKLEVAFSLSLVNYFFIER